MINILDKMIIYEVVKMTNIQYYTIHEHNDDLCIMDKSFCLNAVGCCNYKEYNIIGGHKNGRNDFYLMYLCRGKLKIWHGKNECVLKSGQVIIFPPHTPVLYKSLSDDRIDCRWIHFTGNKAEKLIEDAQLPLAMPIEVSIDEKIISEFQSLFNEYIDRDFLFETTSIAKFINIISLFGRAAVRLNKGQISASLKSALKYIDLNYTKTIDIKELAKQEHISYTYFRTLFKKKTGTSPNQYIIMLRLKNAATLLKQTELSIKEIAKSVGFSDQMYFSRIFKKRFGMTPKEFRK